MDLTNNKEFFRYLVSKVIQVTPSNEGPDSYAEQVYQRALKVYEKVNEFESIQQSTGSHKGV